jgi:hypothetical protein
VQRELAVKGMIVNDVNIMYASSFSFDAILKRDGAGTRNGGRDSEADPGRNEGFLDHDADELPSSKAQGALCSGAFALYSHSWVACSIFRLIGQAIYAMLR